MNADDWLSDNTNKVVIGCRAHPDITQSFNPPLAFKTNKIGYKVFIRKSTFFFIHQPIVISVANGKEYKLGITSEHESLEICNTVSFDLNRHKYLDGFYVFKSWVEAMAYHNFWLTEVIGDISANTT